MCVCVNVSFKFPRIPRNGIVGWSYGRCMFNLQGNFAICVAVIAVYVSSSSASSAALSMISNLNFIPSYEAL